MDKYLIKNGNLTDPAKEVVRQLIDAVYVYGGNRVEVVFKFQDR